MTESTSKRNEPPRPNRGINTHFQLCAHVMIDAARRNIWDLGFCLLWPLLLFVMAISFDAPRDSIGAGLFIVYILGLNGALYIAMHVFFVDNRILIWLPISGFERGRYNWAAWTFIPLLCFAPVIMAALFTSKSFPLLTSMVLTAAAWFPLSILLFFRPLKAITDRIGGREPALFVTGFLAQCMNLLLYRRLNFPWFFVALAPFALAAICFAFRNAECLGAATFRLQSGTAAGSMSQGAASEKRGFPEPWNTLSRRLILITVAGVNILVFHWVLMPVSAGGRVMNDLLFFMPAFMLAMLSFVMTTNSTLKKLTMARSLPVSRTALAMAALGTGIAGVMLPALIFAALTHFLNLHNVPSVPTNVLLIYTSLMVFLPAIAVLTGAKSMIVLVAALGVLTGHAPFLRITMEHPLFSPYPMASTSIMFAACLGAAFFLLRYALLRPRTDLVRAAYDKRARI